MGTLMQNMRYTLRQLRKAPGFTGSVVLTLALGIGLNAAIFTMVDCIFLRPLGYHDADRIVALKTQFTKEARSIFSIGGSDYVDVEQQAKTLEHVAHYSGPYKDGVQLSDRAVYTEVTGASPDFLNVMGVQPVAGRLFSAKGAGTDVVISSAFARDSFGSPDAAVGKSLRYDGMSFVIVGVVPDSFRFPGKTNVWIEEPAAPEVLNRTAYNQRAIGKLREGVSTAQLGAELSTISAQLGRQYIEDADRALIAVPLQEQLVGRVRPLFRLLMGSVFVVLLIVCANVTHLQLVRSTRQRREIAIRTALGARRGDTVVRALLEALALAVAGCAGGISIGEAGLRMIVQLAPPNIPRLADVRLNAHVVLFSFLLSFLVMCITALAPVFRSWHVDPVSALKQDAARGTESRGGTRLRNGLVLGEVALTLMLSVAAVLLVRQLIEQSRTSMGFEASRIALLEFHAPGGTAMSGEQKVGRLDGAMERLRSLPGVESVAAVRGVPTGAMVSNVLYGIRGRIEFAPGSKMPGANIVPITPGYFETMRIPQLSGRPFIATDGPSSEYVAVISKTMAQQSFPGESPIGKEIMCGYDSTKRWIRIVGVVGDVHQDSPGSTAEATLYVPIAQHAAVSSDVQLVLRTSMVPEAILRSAQARLEQYDAAIAMHGTTMQASIGESSREQRFRTTLFGSFAGLSILLAAIGMYGVTAYTVAQKRYEFALRFALGATRADVLQKVLLQGTRVAMTGIVCGVALSLALVRVSETLLGKVNGVDMSSYALAALGVMLIALVAALGPARRAASIEPMEALRTE